MALCPRRFAQLRVSAEHASARANRPGCAGDGAMKVGVRQLLALTIVAIEFTWAYPWVLLVSGTFYGPSAAPLLPPASAGVLLALAFLAVRAAVTRPWSLRGTRVIGGAAGFLSGRAAVRLSYCPRR